jgi:signal transduction histidine kinase
MTSVYGFSELLLTRELPEPIRRKVLENIHRQASSLVVMVNDLLDLARIEARQHKEVRRAPHSLRSLVEPVVDGLLVNGDERRARMDIGTAEHTVNVDDDKFRRALTNVLSNAFKYSPQGGEVVVSTQVGKGIRDGLLGLCVTDHGVGMSPENCRRVFERFFRADPSGAIPGTGLGMSLVKEIVELHGGEVDVASELGHGTSVTLWWPLANA